MDRAVFPSMYTFVIDEKEAVVLAHVAPGTLSAGLVDGAMLAIHSLDSLDYRGPHPRTMVVLFDMNADHFGAADRDRIVQANLAVRHRTVRLLVTKSALHMASLAVMKQRMTATARSERTAFGSLDEALVFGEPSRPGLRRIISRQQAQLFAPESGVVRTAAARRVPARAS